MTGHLTVDDKKNAEIPIYQYTFDENRRKMFTAEHQGVVLDYSRQNINESVISMFNKLIADKQIHLKMNAMMEGEIMNKTENRPVLHTLLRMSDHKSNSKIMKADFLAVQNELQKIQHFSNQFRQGKIFGHSRKPLSNIVCIGIGGSVLGSKFIYNSLKYNSIFKNDQYHKIKFLSNIDPVAAHSIMNKINLETTLFILISKSMTTLETCQNLELVKLLFHRTFHDDTAFKNHLAIITTKEDGTLANMAKHGVFKFWNWVGGRFSVTSAVGALPLSCAFGFEAFQNILRGAESIDQKVFNSSTEHLNANIPLILALLSYWNTSFLNYSTSAILPYSEALSHFPKYIQQLAMESNGKSVDINSKQLDTPAGEVIFGDTGTDGQHSFYQLMHQGRVIPAEFICVAKSPLSPDSDSLEQKCHNMLFTNCISQADALCFGTDNNETINCENTSIHQKCPGGKPATIMMLPEITPYYIGVLLSIYEHKVAYQGFLWEINSFDQFGVELGKKLANSVETQLSKVLSGEGDFEHLNTSSKHLLHSYIKLSSIGKQ